MTLRAQADLESILAWSFESFGVQQAERYGAMLDDALGLLEEGPFAPSSMDREAIRPGLRTLHIARPGRRGRHLIAYEAHGGQVIVVLRILHDAMDLPRHLAPWELSEDAPAFLP